MGAGADIIEDRGGTGALLKIVMLLLCMTMSCSSRAPEKFDRASFPDYVLAYPDMPKVGVRPVDINGLASGEHGIHPCALPFLRREFKKAGLPTSQLNRVRFFSSREDVDAVNDLAFSKGFRAITRDEKIYIGTPELEPVASINSEIIFFHELVHTAQFQSGDLSLSSYALSSMQSFANGKGPHDNHYETQATRVSEKLLSRWQKSSERRGCYADARKAPGERRIGKRDDVIVMFAAWEPKQRRYLPYSMQF